MDSGKKTGRLTGTKARRYPLHFGFPYSIGGEDSNSVDHTFAVFIKNVELFHGMQHTAESEQAANNKAASRADGPMFVVKPVKADVHKSKALAMRYKHP